MDTVGWCALTGVTLDAFQPFGLLQGQDYGIVFQLQLETNTHFIPLKVLFESTFYTDQIITFSTFKYLNFKALNH